MIDSLTNMGIDPEMLLFVLIAVTFVLFVLVIVMLVRMQKIYRRYDFFMRGKDAETLEDIIVSNHSKMYSLQDQEMENRDRMKLLQFSVNNAFQKMSIVKYNAFDGMGGQSSFVLVMLDQNNSGVLLNAMHSRTSCYLYVKEIKNGEPDQALGAEEREALSQAMEK